MSADNFHAIVKKDGEFWVVEDLAASAEYDFGKLADRWGTPYRTREQALVAAHNADQTEYGVIEVEP